MFFYETIKHKPLYLGLGFTGGRRPGGLGRMGLGELIPGIQVSLSIPVDRLSPVSQCPSVQCPFFSQWPEIQTCVSSSDLMALQRPMTHLLLSQSQRGETHFLPGGMFSILAQSFPVQR